MKYQSVYCSKVRKCACALFMFLSCAAAFAGEAQGVTSVSRVLPEAVPVASGGDGLEDVVPLKQVDVRPEFPGGREAMREYAAKYFAGDSLKGRPKWTFYVNARFVVEKDGSVTPVGLKEHYSEKVDGAVLRMLASMPRWTPGLKDGEAVRTGYAARFEVPCNLASSVTVPEFVGGEDVLMKYLYSELKKRGATKYSGKRVKVLAQFVVDRDGSVSDVRIVRHGLDWMDSAVCDVLRSMPQWKPGTVDGQAVRVRYTLPVTFGNK